MKEKMSTNTSGRAATIILFTIAFCLLGFGANRVPAATLTVTNTNDSGIGSLRQAISEANSNPGSDTINFNIDGCPCTIYLQGSTLSVTDALSIDGPGADQLAIRRDNSNLQNDYRILTLLPGSGIVSISGLTLSNGASSAGGAISNNAEVLNVARCRITQNLGGGIYTERPSTLNVSDSVINENSGGSGIINFAGVVSINRSTLQDNGGSGIFNDFGTVAVSHSAISRNTSSGFHNNGTLTVSNSTISGNTGGGVFNNSFAGAVLTLSNSTVTNNHALTGGGIESSFDSYSTTMISSIVAGNTSDINGPDVRGLITSGGNNLIGDASMSSGLIHGVNGDQRGTFASPIDPLLGPLQNNGGPTSTHALLPGSPAINAGQPNGNVIDQRGAPRVVGAAADIGAFESGTTVLTVNTTADTTDGSCDPLGAGTNCTLREAILAANADPLSHESIFFEIPTTDPGYDSASARHSISLTSNLANIDTNLSIVGPGRERLTVRQTAAFAVFSIQTIATPAVSFSGLTIKSGTAGVGSFGAANITVLECLISENSGAGVRANRGSLNVGRSILSSNGSGIYASDANTSVENSDISNNSTTGGIEVGGGSLTIRNSTIANNTVSRAGSTPARGGGIDASFTALTIDHTTINGNRALSQDDSEGRLVASEGGGISLFRTNPALITNSTITANSATLGPGITTLSSPLMLHNTIVAANIFRSDIDGEIAGGTFNLIGNGVDSTGLVNGVDGNLIGGSGSAIIDPRLGPLADNGGPTRTRLLLCGSPAIDRGKNVSSLATDQRGSGFARTFDDSGIANSDGGDATDIGAVELQAALECNMAPVAVDDAFTVTLGLLAEFPTGALLANDSDPEGAALTAILVSGPTNSTGFVLNADGSFTYVATTFLTSDSFTYKVSDGARESAPATVTIDINYQWSGFLAPVENMPNVNSAKAGQAIPLKFSLGGNQGMNILLGTPGSQQVGCDGTGQSSEVDPTNSPGSNVLSYDPATGQYQYVWKTEKSWKKTCRILILKLADGTEHNANFTFN